MKLKYILSPFPISFFVLLFCTPVFVYAQFAPPVPTPAIRVEELRTFLSVIASDSMEGRETGTAGQRKAAAYIKAQFMALGLPSVPGAQDHEQFFSVGYDTVLQSGLSIAGKRYTEGRDYLNELPGNDNRIVNSRGIEFVGYGIQDDRYDDYGNRDVKNKVVIFFTGEPGNGEHYLISNSAVHSDWAYPDALAKKAALAFEKGALAAMVINPYTETFLSGMARQYRKSDFGLLATAEKRVNCMLITHAMARQIMGKNLFDSLLSQMQSGRALNHYTFSSPAQVRYSFKRKRVSVVSSNVVAYLEGTDKKEEYLILTGHYDHLGTRNHKIWHGADDDGSGTCAVLEMAAAFSRALATGVRPRRSIIFMTVSGEEEGLLGSKYYSNHPLFPLNRTTANLNTDMVGRIDPSRNYGDSMNYVYLIGDDKLSSELSPMADSVNRKFTALQLDRKFNNPKDPNQFYSRSDHYNFARKGVPVIFFFGGTHNDYHQPSDTIDKINWELYRRRVEFIYQMALEMANRETQVARDISLPEADD